MADVLLGVRHCCSIFAKPKKSLRGGMKIRPGQKYYKKEWYCDTISSADRRQQQG
jgi:hypothetical protein